MALELRPNCEYCDKDLPPESTEAMICTYECTFCRDCVEGLCNVCPNCGGGFVPRPIRPARDWRSGVSRMHQQASAIRVHSKKDRSEVKEFVEKIKDIAPEER